MSDIQRFRYTLGMLAERVSNVQQWASPGGKAGRALHDTGVHGIPRGGIPFAAMLAGATGARLLETPQPGCLIVDDVFDSGNTLEPFIDSHPIAVLCTKQTNMAKVVMDKVHPALFSPGKEIAADHWIVFPWEAEPVAAVTEEASQGASDEVEGPTDAVTRLLQFIGEDPTRPGLVDTPKRVLKALTEMTAGMRIDLNSLAVVFPEPCTQGQAVAVHDIPFTSLCEHHLLPFTGKVDIAYIAGTNGVIGLSKVARIVEAVSRRLQVQERMTVDIAQTVTKLADSPCCAVRVTASHTCMCSRGVKAVGSSTTTIDTYSNPGRDVGHLERKALRALGK